MQMGGRGDGHRIDAGVQQRIDLVDSRAAERLRHEIALAAIRVGDADQLDAGQSGQNTRAWLLPMMPTPIDADANGRPRCSSRPAPCSEGSPDRSDGYP